MFCGKLESRGSVRSIEHAVAVALQTGADQYAHGFFIFHYKNDFCPAGNRLERFGPQGKLDVVSEPREVEPEGGSFSHLTGDHYVSRILFRDSIDRGQSPSGSLVERLGREERLKNAQLSS